jgi:hypothetical protein
MDKKSIFRDVFSPSNLWALASYGSPTLAAAVSGVLSYLAHLPLSVNLLLALMSAACTVILVDWLKRMSVRGKVDLGRIELRHFHALAPDGREFAAQFHVPIFNLSNEHALYFDFDILNLALQDKTNSETEKLGGPYYLAPGFSSSFLLPYVKGLRTGPIKGRIHIQIKYGKAANSLKVTDDFRFPFWAR